MSHERLADSALQLHERGAILDQVDDELSGEPYPLAPDWWQASDDLWYPPETHPDAVRVSSTPPAGPPPASPPVSPAGSPPGPVNAGPFGPPGVPPVVRPHQPPMGAPWGPPAHVPPAPAPARKGTHPIVIVLAVLGAIFLLMLVGCTALTVVATTVANDFDSSEAFGFEVATEVAACRLAIEEADVSDRLDRLDAVDRAIERCGSVENFQDAVDEFPGVLEPGQTARELLIERCVGAELALASTRICAEIDR